MGRLDDVRRTARTEAGKPLAKAIEFAEAAQTALCDNRWNAAGLSAVHAGISAADAALIASAGIHSISQDHGAVVLLLDDQVPEFTATQRRQLGGLLKMKNRIAYEQRLLTEVEARQLVDHAKRLTRWARGVVGGHSQT
jgi:hypothetical protein